MSDSVMDKIRAKLEAAASEKKNREGKVDAVIWSAVLINAGLGFVPLGINVWTFMGINATMVVVLAGLYGQIMSKDAAAQLIKQIFAAVGWTWVASTLGLKFCAEVLKGAGVITMGGTTVAGMAIDAALCGGITYALGYTVKVQLDKNMKLSKSEIKNIFKEKFQEGKEKVKNKASS